MQRKVTLGKGAYLWDAGDTARTMAVLERGRLGVRAGEKLIGLITPKMVLGESALFTLDGGTQARTAAVVALEEDTLVAEYPASMFRHTFDAGNHAVGHLILMTLIGQTCRNYLLIVAAHNERLTVSELLRGEVRALGEAASQSKNIKAWDEFLWTFRYLFHQRDHSDAMRTELVKHLSADSQALQKASDMMRDLLKGQSAVAYLEEFIAAERDRDKWLEVSREVEPPRR
jgi:CRP-like cAMP-binding protein